MPVTIVKTGPRFIRGLCLGNEVSYLGSGNWVIDNLNNALETWNNKLSEIWQLVAQSPTEFKGGGIWNVIVNIHGALQAVGLALLVLFFVIGVVKTCGSFAEVKRPEQALKLFIRFALAKGVVTYGLELMMALFNIVQGIISTIMRSSGLGTATQTVLPDTIVQAIQNCGFFESIPLWAVTLIGGLFITVFSFIMILTVYGRFFKLYLYTAIAPVPLASFAGEPSQSIGKAFLKGYAAVCLEGAIIVLACVIFSVFASSPPGGRHQRQCRHDGVVLCRGADFQHAGAGRRGENGRPGGARDDIWIIKRSRVLLPGIVIYP